MDANVPPGIQPGDTPELHRLHSQTFEKLCRDLYAVEPTITSADLWGTPGQSQDGIDIIARRIGGDGIEVGQCKAYRVFKAHNIRKAADQFALHLAFWRNQDLRRFMLFVACELDTTQCQKEILKQSERFKKERIEFEVWSASTIVNKLRSHPGVVASYLSPYWVDAICGGAAPPSVGATPPPRQDFALSALAAQANELAVLLSEEARRTLEKARNAWQEGRRQEAFSVVQEIRGNDTGWKALATEVKAKLIRFEASVLLSGSGNLADVRRLSVEAEALDPDHAGTHVLRALIANTEQGSEAALALLPDTDDIGILALRAGLLLELYRVEESLATLDRLDAQFGQTAEGHRLRALALLTKNDVPNAQLEALRALERQPRWESVRETAAMVDYMSALSPAALDHRLPAWPAPVAWLLVKRDDDSIGRLRRAQEVFEELAADPHRELDELRQHQGWRLASLANDPERQEEAVAYCRKLLEAQPDHLPALWWALNRNFAVDLEPSVAALESAVQSGNTGLAPLNALIASYVSTGRLHEAGKLLEATLAQFQAEGKEDVWIAWRSRVEAEAGTVTLTAHSVDPQSDAALTVAESSGDTDAVLRITEERFVIEHDPTLLFRGCAAAARAERWTYVAERAEAFVATFGTAEAVRLGATGAENAGRYSLALSLLDDNLGFFPGRRLPPDMRRQRVRIQRALGVLPRAVTEAEELAREDPTVENLFALASLYESTADLKALTLLARRFVRMKEIPPQNLLWTARMVRTEDLSLARELWRRAVNRNLKPRLLENAVFVGFELGLDREATPLMRRLARLGEKGEHGRVLRSVAEARKAQDETGTYRANLEEAYIRGTIPVHLVSQDLGLSLLDLYHQRLEFNAAAPEPLRQPPLFVRHGARAQPVTGAPPIGEWRLHVDITGLLLAQHFGVLDLVEQVCSPLRIAPEVTPTLLRMLAATAHHQPRQVEGARTILDALASEQLEVLELESETASPVSQGATSEEDSEGSEEGLWTRAEAANGYVLALEAPTVPAEAGETRRAPMDSRDRALTPATLAHALRKVDAISKAELTIVLEPMAAQEVGDGSELRPGTSIFCPDGTAMMLAIAGLLLPACSQFRVFIQPSEAEAARAELSREEIRQASEVWVADLVQRISTGIKTGLYEVVPVVVEDAKEADEDDPGDMFGLRTLLEQPPGEGHMFWVEDRCVSGFQHSLGVPLVGIIDILVALRQAGRLSQLAHYDLLDRLRRANVRFLTPDGDEILYQLQRGRVEGTILVETPQLSRLRRYVAATLVQGKALQRDFTAEGSPAEANEIPYLIAISRSFDEALGALWSDESGTLQERRARADWLVSSLFLDTASARTVVGLRQPWENDRHLLATTLGGLIVRGITFDESEAGAEFRLWLTKRILEPRFAADAALSVAVARVLKFHFRNLGSELGEELEPLRHLLRQRIHDRLPAVVREEIERDSDYMGSMGILIQPVAQVGAWMFERDQFVAAVAEAINGRTASLTVAGEEEVEVEVEVSPADGDLAVSAVLLKDPNGKVKITGDPAFGVLLDRVDERRGALLKHRDWYVGPPEQFEAEVARVVSMIDPVQRYIEVQTWRDTSPAEYYRELTRKVPEGARLVFGELMPPDLEKFAEYYGFSVAASDQEPIAAALEQSAIRTLAADGLTAALRRAMGLPCPLPRALQDAFMNSSAELRRDVLKALYENPGSPLSCIHLVRLLSLEAHMRPSSRRLARRVALGVISSELEVDAFLTLLQWTEQRVREHPVARNWTAAGQLATSWLHAEALFRSLTDAGLKAEWLMEAFDTQRSSIARGLFERDREYSLDIAHPSRVHRLSLLLTGLNYAFEADPVATIDSRLQKAASTLIFYPGVPEPHPQLVFLQDPALATDGLGSFLCQERSSAIGALTGTDVSTLVSANALRRFAVEAVEKLEAGDSEAWVQLYVVAGDLPLFEDLRPRITAAILTTDFEALVRSDLKMGPVALVVATDQLAGSESAEARNHVEGTLLRLAAGLASGETRVGEETDAELEGVSNRMLDVALRLARQQGDATSAAEKFARLASRMVNAWPHLADTWTQAAERLWAELPIDCGRSLAELVVHTRALKNA